MIVEYETFLKQLTQHFEPFLDPTNPGSLSFILQLKSMSY